MICNEHIRIEEGAKFDIKDYCRIDEDANVSVDKLDTAEKGTHKVQVVLERNGAVAIEELKVEVYEKEKPDCGEHQVWDEKKKKCLCMDGYISDGISKELACIAQAEKKDPEPVPTPMSTDIPDEPITVTPTPEPVSDPKEHPAHNSGSQTYKPSVTLHYWEVDQPHGSEYYPKEEYGSMTAAYDACVADCKKMLACECVPSEDGEAYILNH